MRYTQPHKRKSIRLRTYDYTSAGFYFVTIVTQNREPIFGEIRGTEMSPNRAGAMVQQWWLELENKFSRVRADAYIVMPNHIHGILEMRSLSREGRRGDSGIEANRVPLSRVVQWFKTMTTNAYLRGVKENGWPTCPGKLWQRNYFEHVIERGNELNAIRRYIQENPLRWAFDHENPARSRAEEDGWEQVLNENQS